MSLGTHNSATAHNVAPGVVAPSLFSYYSWFWFSREVRSGA